MKALVYVICVLIPVMSHVQISEAQSSSQKIDLCDAIRFEGSKDQCYFDYAQSRRDVRLCTYITDPAQQKQCLDHLNPKESEVTVFALSSDPSAVSVGETENITFSVQYGGTSEKAVVQVEETDQNGRTLRVVGNLNDNGSGGDIVKNDFVYGGTFTLGSYSSEQTLRYRAILTFPGQDERTIATEPHLFYVTDFPIGTRPFDPAKITNDPQTGEKILSDEVLVSFHQGIQPDRIREIVKEINGEVLGVIFGVDVYQIKVAGEGGAGGVYQTIKMLKSYLEVEFAEPNGIAAIDELSKDG